MAFPVSQSSVASPPPSSFTLRPLKSLTSTSRTNDDIHSSITLDPLTLAFLDSPPFQRLRGLNQLGVAGYVYINATHTRFEHSLGVAHLAERMAESLARKQPQLKVTRKDVACVKLAGLCHDLGHGPFSHIYDGELRNQLKREALGRPPVPSFEDGGGEGTPTRAQTSSSSTPPPPPPPTAAAAAAAAPPALGEDPAKFMRRWSSWAHEDASLTMLDALLLHHGLRIDEADLDAPLLQVGDGIAARSFGIEDEAHRAAEVLGENVLTSRDLCFVKECIHAHPLEGHKHMIGRPPEKEFL